MALRCQGCMEKLTRKNRKMYEMHRLYDYHANELCDECLKYFIIKGEISERKLDR